MMHKTTRLKTIYNRIREIQGNYEYDATVRSFVNIGFGGIFVSFVLSAYYLLIGGESVYNGYIILATAVALSGFMVMGLSTYRLSLAALLSSIWLTFVLFPATFFLGGGLNSGASIWFLLGFAYVTLVLSGRPRMILFILQLIIYSLCFLAVHLNPGLATTLNPFQVGIDSLVAVTVVGPCIIIMFYFQERITRNEQQLALDQKAEIERLTNSQQLFFAGMSRKIRTPIGGITGLTEMILRSDNLTDEISKNTRNIVSASDMLLTIIEDIMDMNKMQIGDIKIENLEYDSALLFKELINMLEPKAREKGLELIFDVDPNFPVSLFGDRIRMKQILVNVINNAIKYTRKGHVKFSARAQTIGGSLVKAIYKVEDTGIGIKPESMNSLFSDFSRIDLGANRSIEGTGLGLSIVKGLLTAMGGQIKVRSTYGEGSTFIITLPQNKNGEEKIGDLNAYKGQDVVRDKTRFKLNGGRILIVDDDRMSREVVKKLLSDTGAAIDLCENGRESLRLTAENTYNIIFMDHVMPGMDGVETFHRIRTQTKGRNQMTPIVALTANAGENLKETYQNIGFAGYLSKPVNIALLEEYVIKSMPGDILEFTPGTDEESGAIAHNLKKKVPVIVTTDSTAGLHPDDITRLGIGILPYCISTPKGNAFVERKEIDIDAMMAVRNTTGVSEEVVNTEMAEEFFREQLQKAENVLHVCLMVGDVSQNYHRLCGVADKMGNVTVFESGTVSVGAGLLAVYAARMASEGYHMIHIINELIDLRERLQFRSRIGEVDLLVRQHRFPMILGNLFMALKIHPLIKTSHSTLTLYNHISAKEPMESFVDKVLKEKMEYEDEIFIAHPDVKNSQEEIARIEALIKSKGVFNNIVFVQSSPIIVSNSGMDSLAIALVRKHE